jgi:uncharacterized iron-regulated membrane protein
MKDGFQGGLRQSMSWLHTWAGLLLAMVLYFMFVTGSVGYFNSEIDRWMRPELPRIQTNLSETELVAHALARLEALAPEAKEWFIGLPKGRESPNLSIYAQPLKGPDDKEPEGIDEHLDPATGQPYAGVRKTGGGSALYSMHYALHYIPYDVATYIVGIATMFMFISIVTGIVVHKKIFKDFFTFRPGKGQRSWLDAHNVTSVMALPFLVMITYSGLVFYTYEYMPSVKAVFYGSGEKANKAFEEELNGGRYSEPERAGIKAPLAPLARMLEQAERRWGAGQVEYISIMHPGDANAKINIERYAQASINRNRDVLTFRGATGELVPLPLKKEEPAAEIFSSVILALHEGHFAGPLLRWLYFISGLLGAAMIATGAVLWTTKRRQQLRKDELPDAGLRVVERLNAGTIVGLPIGIAVYFWANRLLPVAMAERDEWEMHALFISWLVCLVYPIWRPISRAWVELLLAAAALYALLPLLNAVTTTIHLGRTIPVGDWVLASVDLAALVLAGLFALTAFKLRSRSVRSNPEHSKRDRTNPIVEQEHAA